MNFQFAHYNYNVKNLETSIQFYETEKDSSQVH